MNWWEGTLTLNEAEGKDFNGINPQFNFGVNWVLTLELILVATYLLNISTCLFKCGHDTS